jgi:hypothetical protein
MTVWSYVDTNKQVGDRNHLKVFASNDALRRGCRKMTRRASRSNMRFLSGACRPSSHLAILLILTVVFVWEVLGWR